MEQLVARLDVAMFNAILRESAEEMPTDPVSDPISDSKVLPIPAGKSSFGSGAQLKNAVSIFIKNLIWAALISSFISRFHYFITFSFLFCKTYSSYLLQWQSSKFVSFLTFLWAPRNEMFFNMISHKLFFTCQNMLSKNWQRCIH